MDNYGLCSVSFRNKKPEEIIEIALKSKMKYIEWGTDIHVPPENIKNAEVIGRLSSDNGILCPSIGSYYKCDGNQDFSRVSDIANAIGADVIRIWAGNRDAEFYSFCEYKELIAIIRNCAKIAINKNQTIAFEYHFKTYCNSAENVLKLINDVDFPNVRSYWQPMYWNSTSDDANEANNIDSLLKLRDFIVNVHVYHWKGFTRLPFIDGINSWIKYHKILGDSKNYYFEFFKDDSVSQLFEDVKSIMKI